MSDAADDGKKVDQEKIIAGRGPAYPYVSLEKAIERVETLRDKNMARVTASPLAFYKALGFAGESGTSRQTLAALNHYGLIEYVGRGDGRNVRLSPLAHRIVFDKVPGSPERDDAVKEAALRPAIHAKLWESYKPPLAPDVVIETFLVRDSGYTEQAAQNVIEVYKETLEYAGIKDSGSMPTDLHTPEFNKPAGGASGSLPMEPVTPANQTPPPKPPLGGTEFQAGEDQMKVLLDGDRIRVSADVDLKGAKRLIRALKANMALLEDDDEDDAGEAG